MAILFDLLLLCLYLGKAEMIKRYHDSAYGLIRILASMQAPELMTNSQEPFSEPAPDPGIDSLGLWGITMNNLWAERAAGRRNIQRQK